MRLHGTVSPDLPLLVVALEAEATHLHVSECPVLVTGAGKVNAAIAVAQILGEFSPASVVHLGTAGALRDGCDGIHEVSRVLQHDLDELLLRSLTGISFGPPVELGGDGPTLATGDVFVADEWVRDRLAGVADLVDMEGYAVARAAQAAGVPLRIVKYVNHRADGNAELSWRTSVDECAQALGAWVHSTLLGPAA